MIPSLTAPAVRTVLARESVRLLLVRMTLAELAQYEWITETMPAFRYGTHDGHNVYDAETGELLGITLRKGGPVHAEWFDRIITGDMLCVVGEARTEQIALNYMVDARAAAYRQLNAYQAVLPTRQAGESDADYYLRREAALAA